MNKHILFKSALVFSILVGMVVVDCGPLAAPTFAQRPTGDNDDDDERRADERRGGDERGGDEGRGRRGGRGGWGRRGGGAEGERRDRERRSNENDEEERDEDRDSERGPRNEGYARQLVKMHDKNGDMMLQEEERAKLTGPAARADLDDDKVITVEEITEQLNRESAQRGGRDRRPGREREVGASDRAAGKPEATAKKRVYTSVTASSGAGKEKEADKRRSYRFTPATERLTGNLPSWFKSRDRNKDGQVSMNEYSRSWTARLARQYRELDLNDDGVITPKEAAE